MLEGSSLPCVFSSILKLYVDFRQYTGSSSEEKCKEIVLNGCSECQKAIQMVNELQLFSKNESLDDLSPGSIRYLTLSAFLGFFTEQKSEDRLCSLRLAESSFRDFFQLVDDYNLPNIPKCPKPTSVGTNSSASAIVISPPRHSESVAQVREEKIRRFKEKQSLEKSIAEFSWLDRSDIDDERKRDASLSLVRYWALVALEELNLIREEISILVTRNARLQEGLPACPPPPTPIQSGGRPPLIITREKIRSAIFGAGYPSLPTMTLDEFYDLQVKKGIFPAASPKPTTGSPHSTVEYRSSGGPGFQRIDASMELAEAAETRAAEEDAKADAHDEEQLYKAREWDAFKDEHRRGSGNRANRG